jgi:hypothetical protein
LDFVEPLTASTHCGMAGGLAVHELGSAISRIRKRSPCLLCAISGLMHRSKKRRYSITLPALASSCGRIVSPSVARAAGRRWRSCLRHCHTFVSFALAASSRKRLDSQDGTTCESSGWMNFLEAASKPSAQRTGRRD